MSSEIQRPDPPYLQVVAQIRQRILSGELRDGDPVPSVRRIVEDWGVALATATKVIAALRSEGLVKALPGIGTVVTSNEAVKHAPRDRALSASRTGLIYPANERSEINEVEYVLASAEIADALGVEARHPVIFRRRTIFRGDVPVSISISWFDARLMELAPKLLLPTGLPEGTLGYIAASTGQPAVSGRDQLAARAASLGEARLFGIPEGSAVLGGRNWFYDADGRVLEYGESVSAPDRWMSYDYSISQEA